MRKELLFNKKTHFILAVWLLLASGAFAQTWTQKASMPSAAGVRDASVCFTLNNMIYLGGGNGTKDFWQYNPANNTWTQKANIPGTSTARGFSIGFSINGKGYIGLGANTTISDVVKDLWQYNDTTNTWTQMANLPGVARDAAFCFVINNKAYIGGGYDGTNLLNDFYVYDPSNNTWATKGNLPEYIIFPFAFSINGKGYISCGGTTATPEEINNTYQYDPGTDHWTAKSAFPGIIRQAGGAFVLNNIAYCGFGDSEFTSFYKDVYKYDPVADHWTFVNTFPGTGVGRGWPNVVAWNNSTAYVGMGTSDLGVGVFYNDWWLFSVPTAVPEVNNNNNPIVVYPNPASGYIHVQMANTGNITYSLYNITGSKMLTGILKQDGIINTYILPPGEYVLEINDKGDLYRNLVSISK